MSDRVLHGFMIVLRAITASSVLYLHLKTSVWDDPVVGFSSVIFTLCGWMCNISTHIRGNNVKHWAHINPHRRQI